MTMHRGTKDSDLTADEKSVVGTPGELVSEDLVASRPRSATTVISLRIDRQVLDELSRLAEEDGRTFSETARQALRTFVRARVAEEPYPLRGSGRHASARRMSENMQAAWTDEDLRSALGRYQAACRRAAMRENAWRSYVDYARRFLAWRTGDYTPRGTPAGKRPVPRASASTTDLRNQAAQYAQQVQSAGREQPTVDTYFRHAMFFIRWLEGEFQPGARLQGLR